MDQEEFDKYEKRAPGWEMRCCKCGYVEHFGKYGIRLGAASFKKYTIGWCGQCRWVRFHAIEKTKKTLEDYNANQCVEAAKGS